MLDIDLIRRDPAAVKANCANRGVKADVDRILALDDERKRLIGEAQALQQRGNEVSKLTGQGEGPGAKRRRSSPRASRCAAQVAAKEKEREQAEADRDAAILTLPNMTHPDAPVGRDADGEQASSARSASRASSTSSRRTTSRCASRSTSPTSRPAPASRGRSSTSSRTRPCCSKLALVQFAMQTLIGTGFTPVITPDLARVEVLEGIGFMPRDRTPRHAQVYTIADTDLCLVGTAEITLGGMHRNQTLDAATLPRRYVGLSHCFRTEAGAPGRDTRGLYRVHQFTKVEMFAFCTPRAGARRCTSRSSPSRRRSSRRWAWRTTSSTPAPATSAARRTASTTSRRGCPAAARRASTAR